MALSQTLSEHICFSLPDTELLLTILDATALKPNAPRCPRCRAYDHISVKLAPFLRASPRCIQKSALISIGRDANMVTNADENNKLMQNL